LNRKEKAQAALTR